ncbi:hypothetical protein ACFYN3_35950 [Streptomyces lavendulae]|uniref:hypothetical protein n=1 Tax=Streptomyces lavendulae TaxID=1914 RepID=UPI0036BA0F2C
MADEPTAQESESLAASLRAYLSETGFAFTGVTAAGFVHENEQRMFTTSGGR